MTHALDLAARLVLLPVLLAQAVQVRRCALALPEASGPREGWLGDGPPLNLLILGDSAAAGVGAGVQDAALAGQLAAHLAARYRVHWRLIARTGATTAETLARLGEEPPARVDVAVSVLGVNDVTRLVPLEVWLARQRRLADLLAGKFGTRLICLSGLPPMGHFPLLPQPLRWVLGRQATRFDKHLGRLAAARADAIHLPLDFDMEVAHMAADGYHPGPLIYAGWAGAIAAAIEARLLSDAPSPPPEHGAGR
ncbi:MAG: SGNH/GDSL hydrolase family protein [Rhodobacteraceae bacterium]|nr:SGNH/GDSL hydrolase family protein [Paracoccaceae bacterium]